jgi:exodeoxyribonuclease VII small subunit
MTKKRIQFEECLAKLEKTVEELERGDLTLDQSLARYEDGVKALRQCYEVLRDAEKRVEVLLKNEDGTLATAPFEPPEDPETEEEES